MNCPDTFREIEHFGLRYLGTLGNLALGILDVGYFGTLGIVVLGILGLVILGLGILVWNHFCSFAKER